jgi:hypothetical protein
VQPDPSMDALRRVRAWLADDGLYVVTVIGGPRAKLLRAYASTLRQTFHHVYLAPVLESWREAAHSTFVLIASDEPLNQADLAPAGAGGLPTQHLLDEGDLTTLLAQGRTVTLTDDYAPMDQMLAPRVPRRNAFFHTCGGVNNQHVFDNAPKGC